MICILFFLEGEKSLSQLGKIAALYSQQRPDDGSLRDSHAECINQWEAIVTKITKLKVCLFIYTNILTHLNFCRRN